MLNDVRKITESISLHESTHLSEWRLLWPQCMLGACDMEQNSGYVP